MTAADGFSPYGSDLFGNPIEPAGRGVLAQRFILPPFSVLDARSGDWQERKQAWLSLGIEGEVGRLADLHGNRIGFTTLEKYDGSRRKSNGTSAFDPVLCELSYLWFCPPGGQVVDPFAGGSVRGIVAAKLGLLYWGSELRPEQVEANEAQADAILGPGDPRPVWVCADAREALPSAPAADLVFTCPPYGDLEVYSDDERDLSAMDWPAFRAAFLAIVAAAVARLKPNRFAAVAVGEFRDRATGLYRGFVPLTWAAFESAGAGYYNEAVLVTPAGSLPVRAGKQFAAGRKLGKSHQQLLVFVKGDAKRAAADCGDL
jgi:hypothetical protein